MLAKPSRGGDGAKDHAVPNRSTIFAACGVFVAPGPTDRIFDPTSPDACRQCCGRRSVRAWAAEREAGEGGAGKAVTG